MEIFKTRMWMEKDKKEKSPWVKVKKRLRNLRWIGERISLNWIKVYGFRQSSLLSLPRLCRMLLFNCIGIGISSFSECWHILTGNHQRCKLLGKIWKLKKTSFYANVSSLNKFVRYINFTNCLKIWFKDSQDTNPKKTGEMYLHNDLQH